MDVSLVYSTTVFVGLIVGMASLFAISISGKKIDINRDIDMIIYANIIELAMIVIIAAVGTDLAEALILPGLVIGMAELLAVSEVLITRNEHRLKNKETVIEINQQYNIIDHNKIKQTKLLEEFVTKQNLPDNIKIEKMEVIYTAPKFIAIIFVIYGALLTGFTGGAIIACGLLFYLLSQRVIEKEVSIKRLTTYWEGITGFSGIMWALWIFGFIGLYLFPTYYIYFLLLAGCALALKVGSKLGLMGDLLDR